jgi:hypothetical protein
VKPDLQYFEEDATWVKPPGAVRADIVVQAAGGGSASVTADGLQGGIFVRGGRDGAIRVQSVLASQLPDLVSVTIGQDGYVLVVTHLTEVPADGEEELRLTGSSGKRLRTSDPLTEHDVADRLDKAALRAVRIMTDARQQGYAGAVKHSRYLTNVLGILAAELQLWGVRPQEGWEEETRSEGSL